MNELPFCGNFFYIRRKRKLLRAPWKSIRPAQVSVCVRRNGRERAGAQLLANSIRGLLREICPASSPPTRAYMDKYWISADTLSGANIWRAIINWIYMLMRARVCVLWSSPITLQLVVAYFAVDKRTGHIVLGEMGFACKLAQSFAFLTTKLAAAFDFSNRNCKWTKNVAGK